MKNEELDILRRIEEHYNLIDISRDFGQLEGEFKQLDKRLDEIGKRINDQWEAIYLGGLNIAILLGHLGLY